MSFIEALRKNLKNKIESSGLTINGLETKAGFSKGLVRHIISGKAKLPSICSIVRIADFLGVTREFGLFSTLRN